MTMVYLFLHMDACITRSIHISDRNLVEKQKVIMIVARPLWGPATIVIADMECIYDFGIEMQFSRDSNVCMKK